MTNGERVSCDSEANPSSNAVAVMLDVTGSMRQVPRILQKNLRTLFNLLVRRQYLQDPAILIGGIGDATCDLAPVQLGQFESGNEIEDDLGRLFLDGGGGGQQTESYELALYFLARKAKIDCFDKRGQKGFAFLIGDELPYKKVKRREVKAVFGDNIQADIPIRSIVKEARRKFEIFYVLPNLTSYYDSPAIFSAWTKLLGQNVLRLEDPAGISELIASTIGIMKGAVNHSELIGDLLRAGTSQRVAEAVSEALIDLEPAVKKQPDLHGTGLTTF